MAAKFDTVIDLMHDGQWVACGEQADRALAEGEWAKKEKAWLLLARSTSLRRQDMNTEAFEPARLAVYLAEDEGDPDLLGKTLANLAWIQHKIQGMEPSAVETQRRWLDLFPNYKTIRDQYLVATLNLGVYLRAAGMYSDALDQFLTSYRAASERSDVQIAQLCRTAAVWEALRLRRLTEAEALIQQGEEYLKDYPDPRLLAIQLLDLAQLCMLRMDAATAAGHAMAAMPFIEQARHLDPHLLPRALEILSRVGESFNDPELALVAAIYAKLAAESDDRHDIVAEVTDSARTLALQHPEVVVKVMGTIDRGK